MSDDNFLARWSRRKTESKGGTDAPTVVGVPVEPAPVVLKPGAGNQSPVAEAPEEPAPPPLPSIESLTPDSDFTPFMKADVEPGLRRQAFKKLIEDPRFNVMDGLDVYIDDYSKPDPLPEGWLEKINAVKYLGIFKAPEEEVEGEAAAATAPLQEAMDERPLARIEGEPAADTPAAEIPPPGVGKPVPSGEGI